MNHQFADFIVLLSVLAIAALAAFSSICHGDPIDATVRLVGSGGIGAKQPCGTGTVFLVDQDTVWVLTCAHVVEGKTAFGVEFWRNGWQPGRAVKGTVAATGRQTDSAVIRIPLAGLGGYRPPAIPFATRRPEAGETIISVGCSNGSWPTLFRGHVLETASGEFTFLPIPANGRSGSAIMDATGETIVGVLHSRVGEAQRWGSAGRPTKGAAAPITAVSQDLFAGQRTALPLVSVVPSASDRRFAQYYTEEAPPGEYGAPWCPPGGCPRPSLGQGAQDGWMGSPGQTPSPQPQAGLWDRIIGRQQPAPAPTPPSPQADLQPAPPFVPPSPDVLAQIDALEQRAKDLEAQIAAAKAAEAQPAPVAAPPTPDPLANAVANTATETARLRQDLEAQLAEVKAAHAAATVELKQAQAETTQATTTLGQRIKTAIIWGGGGLGALFVFGPLGLLSFLLQRIGAWFVKETKEYRDSGGTDEPPWMQWAKATATPIDDVIAKAFTDGAVGIIDKIDAGLDTLGATIDEKVKAANSSQSKGLRKLLQQALAATPPGSK